MSFYIEAQIGDEIEVVFVGAPGGGLQIEGRINTRPAFLTEGFARITDCCRVKILQGNSKGTAYVVNIINVVREGDGRTTLLQKVMNQITSGANYRHEELLKSNRKALAIAAEAFKQDPLGLLDFIIKVLQSIVFRFYEEGERCDCFVYSVFVNVAREIIDEHLSHQPEKAVAAIFKLADCIPTNIPLKTVSDLLRTGRSISLHGGPRLQYDVLLYTLRAYNGYGDSLPLPGKFLADYLDVLRRLICLYEKDGEIHIEARLDLSDMIRARGLYHQLEDVLAPLSGDRYATLMLGNQAKVARGMAELCNKRGDKLGALDWFGKVDKCDNKNYGEVVPQMARIYLELGQFEKAALLYRQAFENCLEEKKDLELLA